MLCGLKVEGFRGGIETSWDSVAHFSPGVHYFFSEFFWSLQATCVVADERQKTDALTLVLLDDLTLFSSISLLVKEIHLINPTCLQL